MNSTYISQPSEADYDEITALWEASVRATHHFLPESEILYFKPLIRNEFLKAVDLHCIRDESRIQGFIGLSDVMVEMLFVHPDYLGNGIGKKLMQMALNEKGIRKVDVNEQNPDALAFYRKLGFEVVGRSPQDSLGKPYPILHLQLN